jgi:predicted phosphodiesterase
MKFQIASDLHLETLRRFPGYRVIEPAPEAEWLILAGDIAAHTHAIALFDTWPVPVIYIHGNHEPYQAHYYGVTGEIARSAAGTNIRYLERAVLQLPNVRVLGTCLWTDYNLYGNRVMAMRAAFRALNDHKSIRVGKGEYFEPKHALAEHFISRAWLSEQLATPFSGRTIVVTHHGPHPMSIHPRYMDDTLNAAFTSDLSVLVEKADLWIHGHVHTNFNYKVGECRVIVNPRGYARNQYYADEPSDLIWENEDFDAQLVVEV